MSVTPFDAYQTYLAIKLHMTTDSYDYFKYCGRTKSTVTPHSFELRKDKWSFVKLSQMYPNIHDLRIFLATNHLVRSPYVRELVNDPGYVTQYLHHKKVCEALPYFITQDMQVLLERYPKPMDMLEVKPGEWPPLAMEVQRLNINIETVCVMGTLMGFFPMWKQKVQDTLLWPPFFLKLVKYTPFISFDTHTMKDLLKRLVFT